MKTINIYTSEKRDNKNNLSGGFFYEIFAIDNAHQALINSARKAMDKGLSGRM